MDLLGLQQMWVDRLWSMSYDERKGLIDAVWDGMFGKDDDGRHILPVAPRETLDIVRDVLWDHLAVLDPTTRLITVTGDRHYCRDSQSIFHATVYWAERILEALEYRQITAEAM